MDLKKAKILITGGSSGIGYDTAAALAAKGAKVVINGRDEKRLNAAAKFWLRTRQISRTLKKNN